MSDIKNYRLFGQSELDHLRTRLEAGLATWSARWLQGDATPTLGAVEVSGSTAILGSKWCKLSTSVGVGYLMVSTAAASRLLGQWMTGESESQAGRTNVNEAWCMDFVSGLMEDFLSTVAAIRSRHPDKLRTGVEVDLPDEYRDQNSGAIFINILFGSQHCCVCFSPKFVEALLQDMPRPGPPIDEVRVRMSDALASVPMKLRVGAWIEDSISIDSLHGLAIGDVLMLGRKVDEPWPVLAPDGTTVAQCYLGQQYTQQVIKLVTAA